MSVVHGFSPGTIPPTTFTLKDGTVVRHSLQTLGALKEGPFWKQYFLNPAVSRLDICYVTQALFFLAVLRFVLSGAWTKSLQRYPSILKWIARRFGIVKSGKLLKFAENTWYTLWHTFIFIWGLWILLDEAGTPEKPGWPRLHLSSPDGRWYWVITDREFEAGSLGWPLLHPSETIRAFYLTQLGYWLSCVLYLNLETRRSDYYVMWIHHISTIALIAFSYTCSYWKIGLVILVLHDVVDVGLYSTKTLHYSTAPGTVTDIVFAIFALCYLVARLLLFPYYCVLPSFNVDLFRELSLGSVRYRSDVPGGVVLPIFLVVLLILHVYWFSCIIRMIRRILIARKIGEVYEDIRSDDEDSDGGEREYRPLKTSFSSYRKPITREKEE